jgi:acyl-coenzyme A thioesterase PaaI-like protein
MYLRARELCDNDRSLRSSVSVMGASGDSLSASPAWWPLRGGAEGDWWFWVKVMPSLRRLGLDCVHLSESLAICRMDRPVSEVDAGGEVDSGIVVAAVGEVMMVMAMTVCAPGHLPSNAALHVHHHRTALAPLTFRARPVGYEPGMTFFEVAVEDREGNRCASCKGSMLTGGPSAWRPAQPADVPESQT